MAAPFGIDPVLELLNALDRLDQAWTGTAEYLLPIKGLAIRGRIEEVLAVRRRLRESGRAIVSLSQEDLDARRSS